MKVRALDSFSAVEVGMVHAGQEVDVTDVSADRVGEWVKRGFIPATAGAPQAKMDAAPKNKKEPAPKNKAAKADEPAPQEG